MEIDELGNEYTLTTYETDTNSGHVTNLISYIAGLGSDRYVLLGV